jgi:DNA-binding transcriptional LysR family regulator
MKRINTADLEIFVSAVEETSFSRAAERNDLVTSAVSKRIAELERRFGKALLVRHGRGVEPTPAGALLYRQAKALLRSAQLVEESIEGFDAGGLPKIRLAANPSTILQFLPVPLARYLATRPDVRLDLLESHSYDVPRMIVDGDADIGIYHAAHLAPGVVSYRYRHDRVGLVVPRGHPLAAKNELFLEEALDYEFLGNFPRHSLDSFLALADRSLSRPPNVKMQVSNFEARCVMIREGLGIAIVPELIARRYLADMDLVLLRLKDEWAQRQFYVCVRDALSMSQPVSELLDYLRDEGSAAD